MIIQNIFQEDINRKINGVVKVDQDTTDVLIQELDEYVITTDLKKHFIKFFKNYGESFKEPTADIGVWISGFFGSGKSHFLKMLSYLLANQEVQGVHTVERFRKKFEDDPATFMLIDSVTKGNTDTILFNIDIEGSINKDKTAVLRVFAKMFYNYLGFYGENLKVAKLEQFIDKRGKTDEFRRVFEAKNGGEWLESREAFAFFEDDIVETLKEVLGMSEDAARNWFNGTETVETSIAQLVSEMKEYVDSKPDDFRLLFMVDEVGQYVGGDTDLLINLQSLVEKIGSECKGKVWVICTGQEAIDEIIKARENEFSRIQARFKTRLSLTSSSADEVIQKRILKKKPEVEPELETIYNQNDSVLRNLFSFTDAQLDIKGYTGPQDFTINFPFVPYQFIIMQKVFAEIRKHGNSGKHLSGGERSMLSGFQEAAQKIQDKDEYALAPFYLFYDTVHTFLENSIRSVIERCQKAANNGDGIEQQDVDVLKLLYLIRYLDDIPANLDNLVILMADDIRLDKITMRESVRNSLNRLLSQNYIGRTGDTYNFLTDEEQDIQRDIYKNTPVDTSAIVERIGQMIFADIYTTKKFRHGKYDFPFDQMVDHTSIGATTGGMKLRIMTIAIDATEKSELRLQVESKNQAIVVLSETPYFESLERAMKVRKYVKQRNVAQLPKSVQDIIRSHQDEASKYESSAEEELKKAIVNADFYVDGEHIEIKSGDAKSKLDQALESLVNQVYSDLELINKNAETN
ncbi:MAG: BREX system P-loop protein BrxC, partial [Bacillota bacterium]|nr:BREX system P-loop protein BrxC [Bacillota bacterium]